MPAHRSPSSAASTVSSGGFVPRQSSGPGPVLVTGFEPFGGEAFNPSQAIVEALHGRVVGGAPVVGATLPVTFADAPQALRTLLYQHWPRLVICLGLAGGREGVSPERVAINLADARIPDNAGGCPVDEPVVRNGPAAYWSTLPVKAITAALRAESIPAHVSYTAGTFVCNQVFYVLLHTLNSLPRLRGTRCGFIHVPLAQEHLPAGSVGAPSLPLVRLVRAIECAIEVSLTAREDRREAEGTLH